MTTPPAPDHARILVVDDEKSSRNVPGRLLRTIGANIVGCRPLETSDSADAGFRVPRDTADFACKQPERAARLVKPKYHPQPVFFTPF